MVLIEEADSEDDLEYGSRVFFFFCFQFLPANSGAMLQIRLRQLERIGVLTVVLLKD